MKVMIRRSPETGLSIYVPKKDLEEPVVAMQQPGLWGGWIELANGWRFDVPPMPPDTPLPLTLDARKLAEEE